MKVALLVLAPAFVAVVMVALSIRVIKRLTALDKHVVAHTEIVRQGASAVVALERRVETLEQQTAARTDGEVAAIRQLSHALGLRIDAFADWIAHGSDPASRNVLGREIAERDFFVDTLTEARIRPLQLAQVFPGIEHQTVEIGAIDPDTSHSNQVDMLYVCAIARHQQAMRIFEFGTYLGRTTYHLALGPAANRVFTLDLDPAGPYPDGLKIGRAVRAVHERDLQGTFYRDSDVAAKIVQLHGDSRTFDYESYARSIDLVVVDAGHTYDLVANDTRHALTLLRPGGVIIWHDFAPKSRDVVQLGREFARERPLFWIEDTALLAYIDGVNPLTYVAPVPRYSRALIKPE